MERQILIVARLRAVGVLVGIDLLLTGISILALAATAGRGDKFTAGAATA